MAVINAPAGNTIAVVEFFLAPLSLSCAHLPRADTSMHAGRWDRSALLGSELKGSTLGLSGLGALEARSRLARERSEWRPRLRSIHCQIRFRGIEGSGGKSLDALIDEANVLTLHTPLTDETTRHDRPPGARASAQIDRGQHGARRNPGRGALLEALDNKQLLGAVIDAYEKEPLAADHPLRKQPDVVLTPHIGASTSEAQRNVAVDACIAVRDALLTGELSRSINVADVRRTVGRSRAGSYPFTASRRDGSGNSGDSGNAALYNASMSVQDIALPGKRGIGGGCGARCSRRNGRAGAPQSHQRTGSSTGSRNRAFNDETPTQENPYSLEVRLSGGMQEIAVAGIAPPGAAGRLTRIGAFHVDIQPRDTLLILTNNDVPGVIGRVGTLLGEAGVNIAEYHQARLAQGGQALAAVSVDGDVSEAIRESLLRLPDVLSAAVVCFQPG